MMVRRRDKFVRNRSRSKLKPEIALVVRYLFKPKILFLKIVDIVSKTIAPKLNARGLSLSKLSRSISMVNMLRISSLS